MKCSITVLRRGNILSSVLIWIPRYRKSPGRLTRILSYSSPSVVFRSVFRFPRSSILRFPVRNTVLVDNNREPPRNGSSSRNSAQPHATPSPPSRSRPPLPPHTPFVVRRVYELKIKYCLFSKPEHGISNKAQNANKINGKN